MSLKINKKSSIPVPPRQGVRGRRIFVLRLLRDLQSLSSNLSKVTQILLKGHTSDQRILLNEMGVNAWDLYEAPKNFENFYRDLALPGLEFLKLQDAWDPNYYSLWASWSNFLSKNLWPFSNWAGRKDGISGTVEVLLKGNLRRALKETGLEWSPKYEEGLPELEVKALEAFSFLAQKILDTCSEVRSRLEANTYAEKGSAPLSEGSRKYQKLEKMYHASIRARELFEKGFLKKVPSQEGLGGSQNTHSGDAATSFTYDLYVAKEISRSLKEVALIAQGKVKAKDILDWLIRTPRAIQKMDLIGLSIYPNVLSFDKDGWRIDNRQTGEQKVSSQKAFDTPLKVAILYERFLQAMSLAGKRYDPIFMSLDSIIPILARVNIRNIGVVVATIDTTDPDITHKGGEREFRVPPRAIVSVDRFIT